MNTNIKNWLGIAGIIGLVLAGYGLAAFGTAFSHSIAPTSYRSFTVNATAKVTAVTDIAEFSFSVITEGGKDLNALQADNTKKMNAVIDYIKSQGVADKDVQTNQYAVSPRYAYNNCTGGQVCPPPEITGYSITQSVMVKVRKDDFSKIGTMMTGVVTKGANSVSELQFTIDDPDALQAQARAEAIKKARNEAQIIATAGGFHVGKLLSIDDFGGAVPPVYPMALSMNGGMAMDKAQAAPEIQSGSQDISATVTVRYEID